MEVLLSVKELTKQLKKEGEPFFPIRDISFDVLEKDCLGIIGFSGAGKSTLLRTLSFLDAPSSGQVIAFEKAIDDPIALLKFRRKIGMVFQHFQLFSSRTVEENIAYPLELLNTPSEVIEKQVNEILALVGLTHKKKAYPASLSGGEKQRVGIARALAHHPKILFCDEPTSALDPQTKKEILLLLKSLQHKLNLTILIITHEMSVIRELCNKVIVLDSGKIVEQGAVKEIFSSPSHPITQKLLDQTIHELPEHLKGRAHQIYRLKFKGESADQPIISQLIRKHAIEVNILMGWIDSLNHMTIGNLLVELLGNPKEIDEGIHFLISKSVIVEKVML